MTTVININGEILSPEKGNISVFDHGFLFGDSVYEVLITYRGILLKIKEHLQRMSLSAKAIGLKLPYTYEGFLNEIKRTITAGNNKESYIRIVVTRGVGEINIDPLSCLTPNTIIYVSEFLGYSEGLYKDGINLVIVSIKRNIKESLNPGIKTGNYLNNILAIMEAKKRGADDGLMLNAEGFLTESTTSNFYLVKDEVVITPSLECGVLEGITRGIVLELARENGIHAEERMIRPEEIREADEAFITSTTRGIMPVTICDDRRVGEGRPGELTKRLIVLYKNKLEEIVSMDSYLL
ncbi:MAG: aminotransferase class IV [Nitrospinae bacterium]|nr:aminotransferase class IV [Nitrospinota bacterium]